MSIFQSLAGTASGNAAPRTPIDVTRPLPQIDAKLDSEGSNAGLGAPAMLVPDVAMLSDGSPAPRARARAGSSISNVPATSPPSTNATSSTNSTTSYSVTTPPSNPPQRRPGSFSSLSDSTTKRRSFLASLVPGSNKRGEAVATAEAIEASEREGLGGSTKAWGGGKYLGISLDGPLGEGWDGVKVADAIRAATKGTGVRFLSLIAASGRVLIRR